MRGIALNFLLVGLVSILCGMIWGIQMSATHDHTLSPAHGHLNLVGWVGMVIFAFYYHLVPAAAETALAKLHFGVAVLGLVLLVPGIALAIQGTTELLAVIGSFLTLGAMLIFGLIVWRSRNVEQGQPQASAPPAGSGHVEL